jgi:CubicO group peptidase (beta-lactamase class C family)
MDGLEESVDRLASETGFSGVVRVDLGGEVELVKAYGLAHRACECPNTVGTRFAIASGVKGLTALTVVSLIEAGRLELATTARSLLGDDLPLIDDRVTVEQLLAHRSGIGDYVDEEADFEVTDYVLPVPVHQLDSTERYLRVLGGHPAKFAPGERFSYCNSGYVVLALLAERASGTPFHELVRQRVCQPAGMRDTAFLRSDELPGDAALGYLTADGPRTNVFHLPVLGSGDGGISSTAADVHAFWAPCSSAGSFPWGGSGRWCVPAARCRPSRCATAWASGCTGRATR